MPIDDEELAHDVSMSPAAKEGDRVVGVDVHLVDGAPMPFPFEGKLDGALSEDVLFDDKPAATIETTTKNERTHVVPAPKKFDRPPQNKGIVIEGAVNVLVNDRPVARSGHKVKTCNDPVDLPTAKIVAEGTVEVGE